ncbi:uncharacterized protein [Temnothorax nylanderi]
MAKTWTVVIFTEEDNVEAVPSNWIHDNKCYWPSLTSEKLKAAIKNHNEPNVSWPSYPIRILRNGTFSNYSTAQDKCRKAEYTSDINSDRSFGNKRKVTKKTYGSSFEENNSSTSDDNNNVSPTKLPTPPRLTNESTSTFIKTKKRKISDEATNDSDRLRNTDKFRKNLSKSNDNNKNLNSNKDFNNQPFMTECKCCPVHLKNNCENYFQEIIRQQNLLKASMWQYEDAQKELTTSINRLLTNNRENQVQDQATSFFTLFDFPLQNEENLIRVDEHLNDETNFNVAINELSRIGGSSVYNFTQRALQMLITNDLAATYSWLGRRTKKTFNKLKLADLIIGSVKRSIPNCTNKECEEAIKKWIRRAKERSNNEKKITEENTEENTEK